MKTKQISPKKTSQNYFFNSPFIQCKNAIITKLLLRILHRIPVRCGRMLQALPSSPASFKLFLVDIHLHIMILMIDHTCPLSVMQLKLEYLKESTETFLQCSQSPQMCRNTHQGTVRIELTNWQLITDLFTSSINIIS